MSTCLGYTAETSLPSTAELQVPLLLQHTFFVVVVLMYLLMSLPMSLLVFMFMLWRLLLLLLLQSLALVLVLLVTALVTSSISPVTRAPPVATMLWCSCHTKFYDGRPQPQT